MRHCLNKGCTVLCTLFLIITACLAGGCAAPTPRRQANYLEYFDTVTTIVGYTADEATFAALCKEATAQLEAYHRLYDIYHTYADVNNLATVNRAGGKAVEVDGRILDLLEYGIEMHRLTKGHTNIAMGSVLSLWHEVRTAAADGETPVLPTAAALNAAAQHTAIESILIDRAAGSVQLTDPALRLDVGAVAKGYAVEQTARYLAAQGYTDFTLNVGGNIRTVGNKGDGSPWVAGVQNPDLSAKEPYICRVAVSDTALVTSGSYQRYFELDGVRYHHIIDKDTLYPAAGFAAVAVLTPDSGKADALSTALFCMTLEEGSSLVASLPDVEALWVATDGSVIHSDGFTPTR